MVALSTHNMIDLADGRQLGYAEYGHHEGDPVFFFHGVPGSRLSGLLMGVLAAPLGGRVIAVDRPGYGLSDPQPGRRIADWPRDVAALADHLEIERFAVVGYSGGGPYAAAVAHAMPDRATGAALVSGMGPLMRPACNRRLSLLQKAQHLAVRRASFIVPLAMGYVARQVVRDAERYVAMRCERTPAVDVEVLERPTIRAMVKEDLHEAFVQGVGGVVRDVRLLAGDWGFNLEEIRVPTHVWHGEADEVVPAWLGRHVADSIPGARATFVPDAGHMLFVDHMGEILSDLVSVRDRHPSHRPEPTIPKVILSKAG